MPRKPRFFLPGVANHVIQRGNNRSAIFFEDQDYLHYLKLVKDSSTLHGIQVHAYVLMTNHVHMLATSDTEAGISKFVQQVGRYYVPYINRKYGRTGTLWEGRYKCSLVGTHSYILTCMKYIELNPVRAGMVADPGDYRWSSYRSNALGVSDSLVSRHDVCKGLGDTEAEIMDCYRELFESEIDQEILLSIRQCVQTGTPTGNSRFREEVELHLKRKVGQSRRGRPSNHDKIKSNPD